ncbi:MAG: metallophosphoesterase [Clostridia bacterium]|nr:metallophosphoesterase [Clostridia bacterium]
MIRFGVFADLHYGRVNVADRVCVLGRKKLSHILKKIGGLPFVFNMGDLINGDRERQVNEELLAELREETAGYNIVNLVGNHDGFHLDKKMFCGFDDEELGAVCSFEADGITFITLDCNFHIDGRPYDGTPGDWKDTICPQKQIDWLKEKLDGCEKAVVCSHHPIVSMTGDPGNAHDTHLPQNFADIREAVEGSGKVLCFIAGHAHEGGMCVSGGVPYITVPAACTGNDAYCADICISGDAVTYNRHVIPVE